MKMEKPGCSGRKPAFFSYVSDHIAYFLVEGVNALSRLPRAREHPGVFRCDKEHLKPKATPVLGLGRRRDPRHVGLAMGGTGGPDLGHGLLEFWGCGIGFAISDR